MIDQALIAICGVSSLWLSNSIIELNPEVAA